MPLYNNNLTFRRKYNYFWRRRWFRRRFRPAYKGIRRRFRTRRAAVRRRRRRAPKKQIVTQWAPARRIKCNIVGFWPALAGVHSNVSLQFTLKNMKNFGGGGIQTLQLNLHDLYTLHKAHLNTWSATNDGTDLCRYYGTNFYCYPNDSFSYIVSWDRDLYTKDIKVYPIYLQHPYLQLLHPDHKVVWSLKHRGKAKAKKINIKPPAQLTNEWYFMSDVAKLNLLTIRFTLFDPDNVWLKPDAGSVKMQIGTSPTGIPGAQVGEVFRVLYSVFWDTQTGDNLVAINRTNQPPASAPNQFANPDEYHADMKWEYFGAGYPYWITLFGTDFSTMGEAPGEIGRGKNVWLKWWPPASKTSNDTLPPDFTKPREWVLLTRTESQVLQQSGWFVPKSDIYAHNIFVKYNSRWQWGGYTPDATDTIIDPIPTPHPGRGDSFTTTETARTRALLQQVQIRDPCTIGQEIIHPWDCRRGLLTKRALTRICGEPHEPSFTATHTQNGTEKEHSHSEEEASSEEVDSSSEEEEEAAQRRRRTQRQLLRLVRHLRDRQGLLE
ncbi:ORF1 [Anelloviridae sp.]|nr:ORF1 [Anelloviridae sp.]